MGDFADQALENMEFSASALLRPRANSRKTCKHCGQRDLRWRRAAETYVLFDPAKGADHNCASHYNKIAAQATVASADEFDDLTKET